MIAAETASRVGYCWQAESVSAPCGSLLMVAKPLRSRGCFKKIEDTNRPLTSQAFPLTVAAESIIQVWRRVKRTDVPAHRQASRSRIRAFRARAARVGSKYSRRNVIFPP